MLAPVLARLQQLPELNGALVDSSGNYFVLTARDAAALEKALPAVRDVLGPAAQRVEGPARDRQLAARARGEIWFSAANIRALSYVEGRALAIRVHDAVRDAVTLDAGALLEAIRLEIFAALDHAHDTGGRASPGWFWKEWPVIVQRIGGRVEAQLQPGEKAALEAALLAVPKT